MTRTMATCVSSSDVLCFARLIDSRKWTLAPCQIAAGICRRSTSAHSRLSLWQNNNIGFTPCRRPLRQGNELPLVNEWPLLGIVASHELALRDVDDNVKLLGVLMCGIQFERNMDCGRDHRGYDALRLGYRVTPVQWLG